jgi:hypothetical protein
MTTFTTLVGAPHGIDAHRARTPAGMSGARLALTAAIELQERSARQALATMCIGVGQGIAAVLESAVPSG